MPKQRNSFFESLGLSLFFYDILPQDFIGQDERLDVHGFCEDIRDESKLFEFLHSIYEEYTLKPVYWLHVMDKEKLVARCLVFIRKIKHDNLKYKLGGIGGLVVEKNYRKKGIARELVSTSEDVLKRENCDFCLFGPLLNDLKRYYLNLGYEELGKKYSFVGRSGNTYVKDYGVIKYFNQSDRVKKLIKSTSTINIGNYDY